MTTPLPPQGSPEPDEKLPGEAELAALYRQLPQSEPGPALDAAVLRAAAQALATGEQPALLNERRKSVRNPGDWVRPTADSAARQTTTGASKRAGPRRLLALGSAASLLLAAGIAWHLHEQPASTYAPISPESAAPAQAAPIAAPPVPAVPAPLAAPMPPQTAAAEGDRTIAAARAIANDGRAQGHGRATGRSRIQ